MFSSICVCVCTYVHLCVRTLDYIGQGHNFKTSWLHKCPTPRKVEVIFDPIVLNSHSNPSAHSGSSPSSIHLGCSHFSLFPLLHYQPSLSIVACILQAPPFYSCSLQCTLHTAVTWQCNSHHEIPCWEPFSGYQFYWGCNPNCLQCSFQGFAGSGLLVSQTSGSVTHLHLLLFGQAKVLLLTKFLCLLCALCLRCYSPCIVRPSNPSTFS